jgi:alpha-glucosidase
VNVEAAANNPGSMLSLYRRLLSLRRASPALSLGHYTPLTASGDVLAYAREQGSERFFIALNLGPNAAEVTLPRECRIVLSTHTDREHEWVATPLHLRGDEGVIAIAP